MDLGLGVPPERVTPLVLVGRDPAAALLVALATLLGFAVAVGLLARMRRRPPEVLAALAPWVPVVAGALVGSWRLLAEAGQLDPRRFWGLAASLTPAAWPVVLGLVGAGVTAGVVALSAGLATLLTARPDPGPTPRAALLAAVLLASVPALWKGVDPVGIGVLAAAALGLLLAGLRLPRGRADRERTLAWRATTAVAVLQSCVAVGVWTAALCGLDHLELALCVVPPPPVAFLVGPAVGAVVAMVSAAGSDLGVLRRALVRSGVVGALLAGSVAGLGLYVAPSFAMYDAPFDAWLAADMQTRGAATVRATCDVPWPLLPGWPASRPFRRDGSALVCHPLGQGAPWIEDRGADQPVGDPALWAYRQIPVATPAGLRVLTVHVRQEPLTVRVEADGSFRVLQRANGRAVDLGTVAPAGLAAKLEAVDPTGRVAVQLLPDLSLGASLAPLAWIPAHRECTAVATSWEPREDSTGEGSRPVDPRTR